jgi:outer membrane immunogenic protein
MKVLSVATALATMFGVDVAAAADLPFSKGAPIAPADYVAPAFTWTGLNVGVNAGYHWTNDSKSSALPFGGVPVGGFLRNSGDNNGFIFGSQLGYSYQFGVGQGVVIGAEADLDFGDIGGRKDGAGSFTLANTPGTAFFPRSGGGGIGSGYLGTARARLGYGWDRILVYGTGGLAYGNFGRGNGGGLAVTQAGFVNPFTGVVAGTTQTTPLGNHGRSARIGWVIGAGLEYAVLQNWTVRAEYLYYDLPHSDKHNNVFLSGITKSGDTNASIARIGLNHKF